MAASNHRRICLIYDCLFPYTVGGAERWYRNLAERLVEAGHEVTYLTLRQWERGTRPELEGVRVVPVGPRLGLYAADGRRRIWPPVVFGVGVLVHLLRRGRRYDVVHTASFPYFSLLAAALARRRGRFGLVVDWHELWSDAYWREYLGAVGGVLGRAVQGACLRVPQTAFCFSRLVERRLHEHGVAGTVTLLEGEYAGAAQAAEPRPAEPVVVFAGRHIPEKRVTALVPALERARALVPGLRAEIFGDGPERSTVLELIRAHGLEDAIESPGFVEPERMESALARALCMVLPSSREGYGLIVVEAAASGVPSIVVAGADNAAAELVEDGVNGFVAGSAGADELASAIARVSEAGPALRESTAAWFERNRRRLSLDSSLDAVTEAYAGPRHPPSARS
jgi:glycosyltransferase involved in cell wall biosynthesis